MPGKPIKSVQRIFEILEMFDGERRPLSANEVSKRLGYPLMSAHELFKSMHQLGYVDFEPSDRSYIPSQAFTSVIDWVNSNIDREADILAFMASLSEVTGETINISRQFGTQVRIMHGLETTHAVGVSVKAGTVMPIAGSLTGLTLLACLNPERLGTLLTRLASQDDTQSAELNKNVIDEVLEELNERGSVIKTDFFIKGIGAICVPIHASTKSNIFSIGVVGPSERILEHQDKYRKSIRKLALEHNLKPVFKIHNPR